MLFSAISPFLFLFLFHINAPSAKPQMERFLVAKEISLEKRYENKYVSDIFKNNILLSMAYMRGLVKNADDIEWELVEKPFNYKFTLSPTKSFAFHNDVLARYKDSVIVTTKAHFNFQEGFKSDGYLTGDGVCHLASLIYWAAKDAGLAAFAPTNHSFAEIPQIAREYGVSIYNRPGQTDLNATQNLYITNNKQNPIEFAFEYDGKDLKVSVYEIKKN